MTLGRVLITAAALWLAAQVIDGIRLADGLGPLATIGTVLVVALVVSMAQAVTRGPHRLLATLVGPRPLPVILIVAVAFNTAVYWLATWLASSVGLGYTVDGAVPALLGSLLLVLMHEFDRATKAVP